MLWPGAVRTVSVSPSSLTSRRPSPGRVIVEDETGLSTISFSFSANTDRDYEKKETLWEYAHHHQEHTGIFNGVPGVTPAKIIDKM